MAELKSKYIEAYHDGYRHKNPVYAIWNKRSKDKMGEISWYVPWRQFVFAPEPYTIYNKGCLDDLKSFMHDLLAEKLVRVKG